MFREYKLRNYEGEWSTKRLSERALHISNALYRENFRDFKASGSWINKNVKMPFPSMNFVKNLIVCRMDKKCKLSSHSIVLVENFNRVDLGDESLRGLCVNIYAEFTCEQNEAASDVLFLRQKLTNSQFASGELTKVAGSPGDLRYLVCRHDNVNNDDNDYNETARFIEDIFVERDSTRLHLYHGATGNLNEARDYPPCYLAWRYREQGSVAQAYIRGQDYVPQSYTMYPPVAIQSERKIGHVFMKNLLNFYDQCASLFHNVLIEACVTTILSPSFFDQTLEKMINSVSELFGAGRPVAWLRSLAPRVNLNIRYTRRLDQRLGIAVRDGNVPLYVRNVFLKELLKHGSVEQVETFFNFEDSFYTQQGVSLLNDYIYDTTGQEDTPLLRAIGLCRVDLVSFLLKKGANLEMSERHSNFSPLKCAERTKVEPVIALVKEATVDEVVLMINDDE